MAHAGTDGWTGTRCIDPGPHAGSASELTVLSVARFELSTVMSTSLSVMGKCNVMSRLGFKSRFQHILEIRFELQRFSSKHRDMINYF